MVNVDQISLGIEMPDKELCVVAMQPYIRLNLQKGAPFKWSEDAVARQLTAIRRTLDIGREGFEGRAANFTLFPEYAIPGLDGVAIIDERISADTWPNGSIILAGVHGLPQLEYRDLCAMLKADVSQSNAPESVPGDQWVNCGVIWTKDQDGVIRRWVQPKIHPSHEEQGTRMFTGSSIYAFRCRYTPSGSSCTFLTFLCFDWIASPAGESVWYDVLSHLNEQWKPDGASLDWTFILQHNQNPNHHIFLENTRMFLEIRSTFPSVRRDNAVVVHANTASSSSPSRSREGGFSACVFSPNAPFECRACRPTYSMQPQSLRESDILERCKDIVFRESGECIHEFTVRVPKFVNLDVTDRAYPLRFAYVHPIGDSDDPRLSGREVHASVKWVGDLLDKIERVSTNTLSACPLKQKAEEIEPEIISKMRSRDNQAASNTVSWAAALRPEDSSSDEIKRRDNADIWDSIEINALVHVLHSITALGLAYSIDIGESDLHCVMRIDERFVQVVAILGSTHEKCRRHFDEQVRYHGADPILVITCNSGNTVSTPNERKRIDEVTIGEGLSFLDYSTLINSSVKAAGSPALKRIIDDILPADPRIV